MYDVLLSFHAPERSLVNQLSERLAANGARVLLDDLDDPLRREPLAASESCKVRVTVMPEIVYIFGTIFDAAEAIGGPSNTPFMDLKTSTLDEVAIRIIEKWKRA